MSTKKSVQHLLIEKIIRRNMVAGDRIQNIVAAGGGSISQSFGVFGEKSSWFIKLNLSSMLPMFDAEAEGLVTLGKCTALRIPKVFGCAKEEDMAYLLTEHIQLSPLRGKTAVYQAGRSLAALHQMKGMSFGWNGNNFIGSSPQINVLQDSWPDFLAHYRLLPQLEMAKVRGASKSMVDNGFRLLELLPAFFKEYEPQISLTHGDLWGGNAALDEAGRFVLFDPAIHYADRETDLAMSELFGGFPEDFYAGYETLWPLDAGYAMRRPLYQLYHVLNHFNLFGGSYQSQAERLIRGLLVAV